MLLKLIKNIATNNWYVVTFYNAVYLNEIKLIEHDIEFKY